MRNLLTNEQLLNDLQETVDNGQIQEQPDEILEIVMSLGAGDYEQLHDTDDKPVVRVYCSEVGFNLHSTACTLIDYVEKTHFNFTDYESGFDVIEGFSYELLAERKVKREQVRANKALVRLQRFVRIEKAYNDGVKNIAHPYLTAKGFAPADINIEYSVIKVNLFKSNQLLELLIYKLNDDAYQVITPVKINGTNKFLIIRKEGALKGSYAVVGHGNPEFIVEGLADAITVNMALGKPVVIGVNSSNIIAVALELPELILIGDNDDAGRSAAKKSGLDAVFCPDEHNDVDDFRQEKGLREVALLLNMRVRDIMHNREPALGDSGRQITLVSAPPGSGKSYHECHRVIQSTGLTIYAVHNKKAMSQDDSRVSEIREICVGHDEYSLPTIRKINDSEDEATVMVQFTRALADYAADDNKDKNWLIFITHKGLSLLNFEQARATNAALVIDEVPDAYKINHQEMSRNNLNTYLNYFDVTVRTFDDYYIVTFIGLNRCGRTFYHDIANKSNMETKLYWKLIDQTLSNRNHANFLHIERKELGYVNCINTQDEACSGYRMIVGDSPKINKCEVFDSSVFDNFSGVRMLSDDAEHSVLALLLKNTQGVSFNIEQIPSRHGNNFSDRISRIIGITENTFSKNKLDTRPDLSNNIAEVLALECDLTNSLWLLNNSSRENGDAIVHLREAGYEVADLNPMTHGRNDLTRFDTVIMMYSLKPNPIEVALMKHLGISQEEITRWREHNVHMQNAFRCSLRNPDSDAPSTLVLPDKASVEYFLMRVESIFGVDVRELTQSKVSYLKDTRLIKSFENKQVGRKCSGDEPLTGAEKNKLSRRRKVMPDLNLFADTLPLGLKDIATMKARQFSEKYKAWKESIVEATTSFDDRGYIV